MGLAVANDVDDVVLGDRVEVPRLVRQVLVVPLQLSGIEVERDGRHRVEVVAPTHVGDPRSRVPRTEVEEVGGGIVRAGVPDGAPANLPRVGGPGLAAGLTRRGDRVPAPETLAGLRIERLDEAPRPHLPRAGDADDHLALDDERRLRHEVPVGVVGDRRVPDRFAGLRFEGDEMRVQRAEDHPVLVERHAAVVWNDADERPDVLRDPPLVPPQGLAGDRVQGVHAVEGEGRGGREHHAVVDDRRRLLIPDRSSGEDELRHQLLDIGGGDLIERAVAPARVRPVVHEPVGGVAVGVQQSIVGDVTPVGGERCRGSQHEGEDGECGDDESHEWAHGVLRWTARRFVR